ncbi:MAG TPA: hypothetical protein VF658_14910 [Pyrinomonadaceae bacterium]|jgi:hypothetical protein
MKGSKIAPWLCIFAGLLWFYAALTTNERKTLSITLGIVFLIIGLVQLKVNQVRFREEKNSPQDKDVS